MGSMNILATFTLPIMQSLTQFNPDKLLQTFCILDDLVMTIFNSNNTSNKVGRPRDLSVSEAATICLIKSSYAIQPLYQLYNLLKDRFSFDFRLPVYKNFVATMNAYTPNLLVLIQILLSMRNRKAGIIKIADSTAVPVCKNIRIQSHKVMKRIATRFKTTTGYFYGLKLHVISDEKGNLLKLIFTTANVDDRKVLDKFLDQMINSLVIADAGYISPKLQKKALKRNNFLLTGVRKNMKKLAASLHIFLLNMRIRIEHLFSVLKERYGLITSLPRSECGYLAHYIRVIFGYLFMPVIS